MTVLFFIENVLISSILLAVITSLKNRTMNLQVQAWREKLIGNFWFIPFLVIVGSIFLAQGMLYVDEYIRLGEKLDIKGNVEGYRSILASITSSMMTIASIVFSMTLVALSLAAGEFGSRILRNFMKDKFNQVILGIYLATFTYSLLILRIIQEDSIYNFSPHISVHIAILLSIVNIILLILFIHHIAKSMQSDTVIQEIYQELSKHIHSLPKRGKRVTLNSGEEDEIRKLLGEHPYDSEISFKDDGYIEYIDTDQLTQLAEESGCVIWVKKGNGDYIMGRITIMKIYSHHELNDEEIEKFKSCIHVGSQRLQENDIRFTFWQIIQIAVRALSPGINDPFTAITAINKLGSAISELSFRDLPDRFLYGDEHIRVILPQLDFNEIVTLAFSQIRFHAAGNPKVFEALLEVYENLLSLEMDDERRKIIEQKKDILLSYAHENLGSSVDLEYVKRGAEGTTMF